MIIKKEIYSQQLVNALLQEDENLITLLSTEHTNDVCDSVRDIVSKLSNNEQEKISITLNRILLRLYDNSDNLYTEIKLNEHDLFLVKENLIYYIGRLGNKDSNEIIRKCYYNENNDFNKMNFAFSACLLGDQEVEFDFISKVIPGSKYDLMIRSWTMAFFKNAVNPYKYIDNEKDDWTVAKKPRITRLLINEKNQNGYKKAMAFRLFDLTVLYLFCKSRSFNDLTSLEYEIIENCNSISPLILEKKREQIEIIKAKILNSK